MNNGITFQNGGGGIFYISSEALTKMKAYIQDKKDKREAGGVLLGRYLLESEDVIVDDVSVPFREDKRTRFSFFRRASGHQVMIDQKWKRTRQRCNYLGGWHTHPESIPQKSDDDDRDWRKALKKEVFDSEGLFFVIVGIRETRVWEGLKKTFTIRQLTRA